jgi:NAD(P)-dependent dehydrogenase (short-subunit alcohol dehydrogenase family)
MNNLCCVITGGSRGIGLAIAERMARAGFQIVISGRTEADLDAAVERIGAAGTECAAITADVGIPAEAREVIRAAHERFGRIDVLVNNAGVAPLIPVAEMAPADFDQVTHVNINGIFHATQAVWPIMQAQGAGVIVNISSMAAADPFPGFAVYGASKAWVNTFTKALAGEGKAAGIRVFAVAPGAVETGLMRQRFPDFPPEQALAPDDVAQVVEALCDDRMHAAVGETIFVRK